MKMVLIHGINLLKAYWLCDAPTGLQFKTFTFCHTVLCVLYLSQNKYQVLPGWFL